MRPDSACIWEKCVRNRAGERVGVARRPGLGQSDFRHAALRCRELRPGYAR